MQITIPTYFTLFRLVLIPLMVLLYFVLPDSQSHFWAALMFLIASLTDYIDGYLARKLNAVSPFGRFLDPVADKLIVSVALVLIVYEYRYSSSPFSVIVTIGALIILVREFFITSLREWMAGLGLQAKVSVSFLGKVKTFIQMFAIVYLLWRPNIYSEIWRGHNWIEWLTILLFLIAVGLTVWSMIGYTKNSLVAFMEDQKQQENH